MTVTIDPYNPRAAFRREIDEAIAASYRAAFSGFPWNSEVTIEEARKQLQSHKRKPGFEGLIATANSVTQSRPRGLIPPFRVSKEHDLLAAMWWDSPTQEQLAEERGAELAKLARNCVPFVWGRELLVRPEYQGKKIGLALRRAFIETIRVRYGTCWVFTRMREDNIPVIRIAEKQGYKPTGIRVSAKEAPGIHHEYWCLAINTWEVEI